MEEEEEEEEGGGGRWRRRRWWRSKCRERRRGKGELKTLIKGTLPFFTQIHIRTSEQHGIGQEAMCNLISTIPQFVENVSMYLRDFMK